ncbi:hypothetical protein [Streptomyces sp. NPDC005568]|uniref:hypothetical protein n=1 Tax=Streptomyces sp. NPDC005568 TaxID=3156887 RepID=UPI0033A53019
MPSCCAEVSRAEVSFAGLSCAVALDAGVPEPASAEGPLAGAPGPGSSVLGSSVPGPGSVCAARSPTIRSSAELARRKSEEPVGENALSESDSGAASSGALSVS